MNLYQRTNIKIVKLLGSAKYRIAEKFQNLTTFQSLDSSFKFFTFRNSSIVPI